MRRVRWWCLSTAAAGATLPLPHRSRPPLCAAHIAGGSGTANARANSPEEIAAAIEVICEKLRAKSPTSRLVVMGVFPRGLSPADPQRAGIKKLNALLAAAFAGQAGLTFLDIGEKFLEPDGSISKEVFSDGTHPTEKGYAIWKQVVGPYVK